MPSCPPLLVFQDGEPVECLSKLIVIIIVTHFLFSFCLGVVRSLP